jgi:hypothetical protein
VPDATVRKHKAFEEIHMKRFFGFAMILAFLSVPVFAANNSQTVKIPAAVKVGSTQIPAGDCKVTWTSSGSNVQVSLIEKGKTLVTVPAKIVEQKHNLNGITTNTEGGAEVLVTINLSNISLVLGSEPVSGQ